MDGMLTQEEIDALTGGNNSDSSTQQASLGGQTESDAASDVYGHCCDNIIYSFE